MTAVENCNGNFWRLTERVSSRGSIVSSRRKFAGVSRGKYTETANVALQLIDRESRECRGCG
jgi:hypothetical protein